LDVYIGRPFNLVGPGEQPTSVCSAIARQISAIESGRQEPVVRVGNLAPERDFVDIRDCVAAYWAIVTLGQPGEVYNICSGRSTSIKRVLELLLAESAIRPEIVVAGAYSKQADISRSVGSAQKLRGRTGWQPEFELRASLAALLNAWRRYDTVSDPAAA
jgi:GDP-4-dehydro-6-deoxy-D-mannose reductase